MNIYVLFYRLIIPSLYNYRSNLCSLFAFCFFPSNLIWSCCDNDSCRSNLWRPKLRQISVSSFYRMFFFFFPFNYCLWCYDIFHVCSNSLHRNIILDGFKFVPLLTIMFVSMPFSLLFSFFLLYISDFLLFLKI